MKRKLLTIIALCMLLSSCVNESESSVEDQDSKTESSSEDDSDQDNVVENVDSYTLQGQWDDIVYQIQSGNINNLEMYLDYGAPTFSEEEWDYIDFSDTRYAEAFASYDSFEDLPDAEYFAPGAKVVTVSFTDEVDGMTFESTSMIYLEERDGLLWIIGSAMAG